MPPHQSHIVLRKIANWSSYLNSTSLGDNRQHGIGVSADDNSRSVDH